MSDLPRDEHLRAALRHAPDAGLSAPPEISAQILAAAHRAASEAQPAAAKPRPRWWAPRAPWRLGASGAFATLLLAGVIGLIWRGGAPGPATDGFGEPMAARTAEAPATAAPPPAPASAARDDAPPPKPPPAREAAARQRDAPAPVLQRAQKQEADREEARRGVLLKESAVSPPPPPAPAPAPAAAPVLSQATTAAAERSVADNTNAGVLGRAAPAAASPARLAVPRPEAPWVAALATGPEVQWTVDGEGRAPASNWLQTLAAQTQGRWRPAPDARPEAADARVQWQRGDQVLGQLWLGAERVLWCDAQNRCEQATLAPDVASALRKGLAR